MVRLIIIFVFVIVSTVVLFSEEETQNDFTYEPPSVITIEILPPIEETEEDEKTMGMD